MRLTNKIVMRLTNKMGIAYEVEDFSNCYEAVDKLGKLEDIEELCEKVTERPIYFKSLDGIVKKSFAGHNALYQFETGRVFLFDDADRYVLSLDLQYYGKAWAFTKEELLKGNEK